MTHVITEELLRSAGSLEEKVNQYQREYEKMYAEIESLKVDYQGQSSEAFNNQINAFKPALEEMVSVVNDYIAYLKNTANNYTTAEDALTDSANALKNI